MKTILGPVIRAALLATVLLATGCGGHSPGAPIWVAHVATLSGPDRQAGESAARGIRLAVEDVNKDLDAGVGRPFKVIHSDTRGKLEAFEAEAVRLAMVNRASFLLGGTTPEEVERLDRSRLPLLTPCGVPGRAPAEGVYFCGISNAQQARALATLVMNDLKPNNLVVIEDERTDSLVDLAEALVRELPKVKKDARAPAVQVQRFGKTLKVSELAKTVQELVKQKKAEAVVFAGRPSDLRELGPCGVPVVFAGEDAGLKVLAANRPAGQVLFYATAFTVDADAPRAAEFARRYKAAFGEDADVHAAVAYDNLRLLFEAVCHSKDSLTIPRVREELVKLNDVPGLVGSLSFTPERQLRRPALVVRLDNDGAKTVKRVVPD